MFEIKLDILICILCVKFLKRKLINVNRTRKVSKINLHSASRVRGSKNTPENTFHTADEDYRSEMLHLRKKLQRTTIETVGVNGVQLWAAALRLMALTRAIVPPSVPLPPTPVITPMEEPPESPLYGEEMMQLEGLDDSVFPPLPPVLPTFPHKILRIVAATKHRHSGVGAFAVAKPARGKGLAPRGSPNKSDKSSSSKDVSASAPTSADSPIKFQKRSTTDNSSRSLSQYTFEHRSATWPMGLHPHLWNRILLLSASDDEILSTAQRDAVVRYASDRNTLRVELMAMGKADSVQLWGVLDRMGCLEYEMEM
jgi:hypothetical protein